MNPLLYYDSIYSLTRMKKQEDSYRRFIFEFITNEWNESLLINESSGEKADDSKSMSQNSFIQQLIKVSNNGRNYSQDEINDHVGTMLVAVSSHFKIERNFLFFFVFRLQSLNCV
jgi:hypothetical protein